MKKTQETNQRNKKYYSAVLLFILSLAVFFFTLYINSTFILEKKEIPVNLKIGEQPAFNLSQTAFDFGTITPGSSASREIILENNNSFAVKYEFRAKGKIKKFLLFEKNIYLASYEKKRIEINTIIPNNEEYGEYSGKIIAVIKKRS